MNVIFAAIGLLILAAVSFGYSRTKRPLLSAIKGSFCGLSALLLINLTSAATGCYIVINIFTVFVALVLSLPGVTALLFLNVII